MVDSGLVAKSKHKPELNSHRRGSYYECSSRRPRSMSVDGNFRDGRPSSCRSTVNATCGSKRLQPSPTTIRTKKPRSGQISLETLLSRSELNIRSTKRAASFLPNPRLNHHKHDSLYPSSPSSATSINTIATATGNNKGPVALSRRPAIHHAQPQAHVLLTPSEAKSDF